MEAKGTENKLMTTKDKWTSLKAGATSALSVTIYIMKELQVILLLFNMLVDEE